ncbi:MAG TPA: NUDIX domain-containing protein [Candidatus Saccharimonadales bacterium]|nr:NUDIX domain-containing protein [Candidatus Saccharimonadales bacterium]
MANQYPPVVIVDGEDQIIGAATLADAWAKSLRHRIVIVIVEDYDGRILLHRRAPDMQLFPGRWDTAGGHVDVTPAYLRSARLELWEEVGVRDLPLKQVGYVYTEDPYDNGVRAKRFIKIYWARYDGQAVTPGAGEVTETGWFTHDEIAKLAGEHPELVSECLYRSLPYILGSGAS